MIDAVPGVDPERKMRLIKALDVDPAWRMHQVRSRIRSPVREEGFDVKRKESSAHAYDCEITITMT